MIDGETVLLSVDGRSDFDGLHSRQRDAEVEFHAFDVLASDSDDLRGLPPSMRKASLSQSLSRARSAPDPFRHACLMKLEGMATSREFLSRRPERPLDY